MFSQLRTRRNCDLVKPHISTSFTSADFGKWNLIAKKKIQTPSAVSMLSWLTLLLLLLLLEDITSRNFTVDLATSVAAQQKNEEEEEEAEEKEEKKEEEEEEEKANNIQ